MFLNYFLWKNIWVPSSPPEPQREVAAFSTDVPLWILMEMCLWTHPEAEFRNVQYWPLPALLWKFCQSTRGQILVTGQRTPGNENGQIWWATTRTIIAPGLLLESSATSDTSGATFGHIQFLLKMNVTWVSYHFWEMFRPKPEVLISFADFCSAVSVQCNARNNTISLVCMDYFNSLENLKPTLLNFHQLLPLTVLFQWTKYYFFLI